jgi:hypothetical protein
MKPGSKTWSMARDTWHGEDLLTRKDIHLHLALKLRKNQNHADRRRLVGQRDKVSHIDTEDDHIDTVISRIIRLYSTSIWWMTISIWSSTISIYHISDHILSLCTRPNLPTRPFPC